MTHRPIYPLHEAEIGERRTDAAADDRRHEAGFTFMELIVAVWLIGVLSVLALGILNGRIEKAKLARCFVDIRSIQSTVWTMSDGITWPEYGTFWESAWSGKRPGPYHYFPNNIDRNSGHGNDLDICDEENPGKSESNRDCKDIEFVIVCQHNHRQLANYVYIEDEGPPTIAGWSSENNPGYDRWIDYKWEN
jgi:prepilin-type N-terminal cleavage/methylation domain-containing protein